MPARPLRIAWLGPAPNRQGGVTGVAAELLRGLGERGHQLDCFFPAAQRRTSDGRSEPGTVAAEAEDLKLGENVSLIWGTSAWQWNRWYSRGKFSAFASGMLSRSLASLRLRREIARRHREQPYDLIYQFSTIESPGVPARVARAVPLVIHPETHIAGELRWLISERRLSFRGRPRYVFAIVATIMFLRVRVQRRAIGRASLLVCISKVFRDHLVADYGFPREATTVVPNPVRVDSFATSDRHAGEPPTVLVLGRVATRKGIEDVVAVARMLLEREVAVRIRVVGGPSLWSDYTSLLDDLPPENAEYTGSVAAAQVPQLLGESDVLLQASKYEPFALTVGEALAAGVPVVATTEVGAGEGVDRSVLIAAPPGDVSAMAAGIAELVERLRAAPAELRARARAEAERQFAPEVVCEQISAALEQLVEGTCAGESRAASGAHALAGRRDRSRQPH